MTETAARIAAAVTMALFNAGLLALATDAPGWALMSIALLSSEIVVWGTHGARS